MTFETISGDRFRRCREYRLRMSYAGLYLHREHWVDFFGGW
jgi:hypothetical protein